MKIWIVFSRLLLETKLYQITRNRSHSAFLKVQHTWRINSQKWNFCVKGYMHLCLDRCNEIALHKGYSIFPPSVCENACSPNSLATQYVAFFYLCQFEMKMVSQVVLICVFPIMSKVKHFCVCLTLIYVCILFCELFHVPFPFFMVLHLFVIDL